MSGSTEKRNSYFCHTSSGRIKYDPMTDRTKHYEPWWAILLCDQQIVEFYSWLCLRHGRPITQNKLWGAHISFVKGEEPLNKALWKFDFSEIEFRYTNQIRFDNRCHAWLDVECERLHEIRAELGLPPYPHDHKERRLSLHLTLGRWV